ncbi:MAG: diguanylate cyclase [Polyangiales bacterium]
MFATPSRILLVDPNDRSRALMSSRLRMQGYLVEDVADPLAGAKRALESPPAAVVSDLWMSGISGAQLCRLMKAEAATGMVPVILLGPASQRDRYWAERAGAADHVVKGRVGDLMRALRRAVRPGVSAGFFTVLSDHISVQDRIAQHLDEALFRSVVASEVRALSASLEFDRLFDLLSQFVSRVASYRWLALETFHPHRVALHTAPSGTAAAQAEVRELFTLDAQTRWISIEDDDAWDEPPRAAPCVAEVSLGETPLGRVAMYPRGDATRWDESLVEILGVELASPLRIVSLVEETRRMARVDPLTGLLNRRACMEQLEALPAPPRGSAYAALLDVDHFKQINDRYGHATGDRCLVALGALLARYDDAMKSRWGGEEFLLIFTAESDEAAFAQAEQLRAAIAEIPLSHNGIGVPLTASLGVARRDPGDTLDAWIDRADQAMYRAKTGGRDRVELAGEAPRAIAA